MKKIITWLLLITLLSSLFIFDAFGTDNVASEEKDNMSKFGQTYKLMGNNILMVQLREKETPTKRFDDLMNAYKYYDPDIFGLQECDELWHDVLDGENGFKTLGYASAVTGFGPYLRNPIYYKTDKFKVLDCGFKQFEVKSAYSYTWALFEVLATGERFIVSSTHFTWVSLDEWELRDKEATELIEGLSALEEKFNAPVLFLGDFNANLNEAAYKRLSGAYSSARECAKETRNMQFMTENPLACRPNLSYNGASQIDHIFYTTGKVIGESYEVFVEPIAYAYADHVPHMLEFKLVHIHSFDNLTNNGDTHTGTCLNCGETVTESHDFIWNSTDNDHCHATCVCGASAHREHYFDTFDITDTTHKLICKCRKAFGSEAEHSFDNGVITREPTCFKVGIKTYTCSVCNFVKTESLDMIPVPQDGHELQEFGQKHFGIEYKKANPVADGVISDGEYTILAEDMVHTPHYMDENSFIINDSGRVESMSAYAAYNDDVIALSFKIKVSSAKNNDLLAIQLGFKSNTDNLMKFHLNYNTRAATISYGDDASAFYVKSYAAAYADEHITYELILNKRALERYADKKLENMYARVIASAPNGTGTEEFWFAFACGAPLSSVHKAAHNRYPHVLNFLPQSDISDETTEPESEEIVTDPPESEDVVTDITEAELPSIETEEPQTETYLPETENTITESESEISQNESQNGCNSAAASVAIALAASLATCDAAVRKKKK